MRATTATLLLDTGVDIRNVQDLLGHRHITTTQIYDKCRRTHGRGRLARRADLSEGLDKSVIRALVQESAWVRQHENLFVLGPTGVGKSFVACALAQKACRGGYSALYTRAQSLFRDLAMARADGSFRSLLALAESHRRSGD